MALPNFSVESGDGNAYVANMTHHHHIDNSNEVTVMFEATEADDDTLLAATTVTANSETAVDVTIPESFGRSITVTSTDAGDVTLVGTDFLGQVMTETLTCIVGDVDGAKAFKTITRIDAAADLAGNVTLKAGPEYGLPFCAVELVREVVDGAASTEGAITAPDTNTPTATTGDTRGTYNPNTAGDGAKDIEVTYVATSQLTGGLYGQVQA